MVIKMTNNRRVYLLLFITVIYALTAYFSNGYHHPDEHYQIIEFAGLKAGWNDWVDMAWEYDAQIRPVLQPMIAFVVIELMSFVGTTDPFILAMCLRFLTAFFALFSICFFVRSFLPAIDKRYHTAYVILSFLLWFLPFVNVRFSSESWAGLTLMLSVALVYKSGLKDTFFRYIGIGILMGMSFEFRFQMALAIIGVLLWMIIVRKSNIRQLAGIFIGGLFVLVFCTLLDSWYYGEFVFTPYKYFEYNIVQDVASIFGISPWYYYFERILNAPTLIIGFIILCALIIVLVLDSKNLILWTIIPFLVIQSFIPHKELRFLFPIVNFTPFILVLAYQSISPKLKGQSVKTITHFLLLALMIINSIGLIMMTFKPAGNGKAQMARYIREHYPEGVTVCCLISNGPFSEGWGKGLTARFYIDKNIDLINISHVRDNKVLKNKDLIYVLPKGLYFEREYCERIGYSVRYQSIPRWIEMMNALYRVYYDDALLILYSESDEK